ncbi:hypothetical protein ACLB2K_076513 [Fragaria x ananassa]
MGTNFHLHLPHLHHHHSNHKNKQVNGRDVPKGCLAIKVGVGEEQQRFVVPVLYFNHPLFIQLLKEAEKEYGFDQKGTITIPCHVEEFRYVQGMIDRERSVHGHHHHHHVGCFRLEDDGKGEVVMMDDDDEKFKCGMPIVVILYFLRNHNEKESLLT